MPGAIRKLLQGRPLGHPLHPMIVHLPIGLWMLSFVMDVLGFVGALDDDTTLVRPAFYTLLAGLAFAVLAIVTGLADYADVRKDHPARRTATKHMLLNLAAMLAFGVSALYRIHQSQPDWLPTALAAVGVVLVSVSGYLGGKLVYDDGLAVGRHRRRHDPHATAKIDAPTEDGYVDAMAAADLPHDTPMRMRMDINGNAMVIVRNGGTVYAVQEFCTHRCGPLSEGTVEGGNIRCPWHRSCFELSTGKVAEGPARIELRRFDVREEDGRIRVRIPS
jgi:nitrite reductase/ring-hydroxylating ferredoxin subunit/uncharacterized membrane protein